jgi:RNA polymerase sigma-70 factor (ECF subfamily)
MKQKPGNTIPSLSDEEIAERVGSGEKQLFEALMRKFNLRLYRIGMAIMNDDEEV